MARVFDGPLVDGGTDRVRDRAIQPQIDRESAYTSTHRIRAAITDLINGWQRKLALNGCHQQSGYSKGLRGPERPGALAPRAGTNIMIGTDMEFPQTH